LDVLILDSKRYFGKGQEACFSYLWQGNKDKKVMPWVRWERIAVPKALGGWGLKNIFLFSKALAAKCSWHLIKTSSLWTRVVYQKYIAPLTTLEWIRDPNKNSSGISIIWKVVIKDFDLIGNSLVWRVSSGRLVHLGLDPWAGSKRDIFYMQGLRLDWNMVVSTI
jgi:hypothetical protein